MALLARVERAGRGLAQELQVEGDVRDAAVRVGGRDLFPGSSGVDGRRLSVCGGAGGRPP